MKKIALILSLLLLAGLLGCGSDETTPSNNGNTIIPDDYDRPFENMDRYEFVISSDLFNAKSGADPISDEKLAIYDDIQKKMNCTITVIPNVDDSTITSAALSGEKFADFFQHSTRNYGAFARANYLIPFDSDEMKAAGMDTSDTERWFQPLTICANFWGTQWGGAMASKYIIPRFGSFAIYNKRLLAGIGYTEDKIVDMIKNYEWDCDVLISMAKAINKDTTGDGMDPNSDKDIWGLGDPPGGDAAYWFGSSLASLKDGKYVIDIDSPEFQAGLDYSNKLFFAENITPNPVMDIKQDKMFAEGKIGIYFLVPNRLEKGGVLQNCMDDYGVLPPPLGNSQYSSEKYSMVMANTNVFFVPISNKNINKSVPIMNALSYRMNDDSWQDYFLNEYFYGDQQNLDIFLDYAIQNICFDVTGINDKILNWFKTSPLTLAALGSMSVKQAVESAIPPLQKIIDECLN